MITKALFYRRLIKAYGNLTKVTKLLQTEKRNIQQEQHQHEQSLS